MCENIMESEESFIPEDNWMMSRNCWQDISSKSTQCLGPGGQSYNINS